MLTMVYIQKKIKVPRTFKTLIENNELFKI